MLRPSRRAVALGLGAIAFPAPVLGRAQDRFAAAAAYSAGSRGISMLVLEGGREVFRDHPRGPERPFETASGTKSFSGVLAAALVQDGLLRLDERCADTLTEWRGGPVRGAATIRSLLDLSSGIGGGPIGRPPSYAEAVAAPAVGQAGTFRYGPRPFQVFGEIVRRKLEAAGRPADVLAFLKSRLLDLAGVQVGAWQLRDGQPTLPSGAALTATEWARFGRFVAGGCRVDGRPIVDTEALAACFASSPANPGYGLTWWLLRPGLIPPGPRAGLGEDDISRLKGLDVRMAAGAGNQRLYLIPERDLVVVRQADGIVEALRGRGADWSDVEFLVRLLGL
ncbi:MAG: serine hydrolase [Alphaproteobacteria bacterium]|nr:serine hydrolase [Alphaproteobacteria bacterium]MBU1526977.1 serine hydrolase [Alphaproteobacteria bacterium]MBU2118447.1 serine hydrolase [Alphaproteobacteria bacterium]MBU2352118.1 serine hydrolase [Alphaproteobacteria bacterium]MBU2381595.1 serine hydrolase [Alphaproteobacteria bacterium]